MVHKRSKSTAKNRNVQENHLKNVRAREDFFLLRVDEGFSGPSAEVCVRLALFPVLPLMRTDAVKSDERREIAVFPFLFPKLDLLADFRMFRF